MRTLKIKNRIVKKILHKNAVCILTDCYYFSILYNIKREVTVWQNILNLFKI